MIFKDCLEEFEDICMLCANPDNEEIFDNDNDICIYDSKKQSNKCIGFMCGYQSRLCDLSCRELNNGWVVLPMMCFCSSCDREADANETDHLGRCPDCQDEYGEIDEELD